MNGYTVVEPVSVMATHLTEVVRKHADEILNRDATKHLIDEFKKTSPAVVEELIPSQMKLAEVQQVLQMLLREQVPIRQLAPILETLGEYAARTKDPVLLTEYVRHRLARAICTRYRDREPALRGHPRPRAGRPHSGGDRTRRTWDVYSHVAPGRRDHLPADQRRSRKTLPGWPLTRRAGKPADSRRAEADDCVAAAQAGLAQYNEITRDTQIESMGMVVDATPAR